MNSRKSDVDVIAVDVPGFGAANAEFMRSLESALSQALSNTPSEFHTAMSELFESLQSNRDVEVDLGGKLFTQSMYVDIIDAVILDADANVCERRIRISENAVYALLIDPDGPLKFGSIGHTCGSVTEPGAILKHSRDMASWTTVEGCPGCLILKFIEAWLLPLMRAATFICSELARIDVFGSAGWVRVIGSFNDTVYIADYPDGH